jgi:hypothetical protein
LNQEDPLCLLLSRKTQNHMLTRLTKCHCV